MSSNLTIRADDERGSLDVVTILLLVAGYTGVGQKGIEIEFVNLLSSHPVPRHTDIA